MSKIKNQLDKDSKELAVDLQREDNEKQVTEAKKSVVVLTEEIKDTTMKAEVGRKQLNFAANLEKQKEELELKLTHIKAEVDAVVNKGKAISPQLIAALQALGDKNLVSSLSENLSIWGHLGGKSVVDVMQNLLKGTKLENINTLLNRNDIDDFEFDDEDR